MLRKRNRLNLARENFFRGDSQFSSNYFKLIIKKGSDCGPKIGFIVSGKVGNAVTRNKVKRALSEAVGENLDKIPSSLSLIFIAFPQSSEATREQISENVNKVLLKL